jgi:hypothetical protein
VKVKGLVPLAAKTDRIDAWVLAELARRDLVPAIWLPDPTIRAERERARFRLHLVRHRTADPVEPAKSTPLEKLGDGQQALSIANAWVRTKLAPKAMADQD